MDKSIKELKEVFSIYEANALIKKGWIFITAVSRIDSHINYSATSTAAGSTYYQYYQGGGAIPTQQPINPQTASTTTTTVIYIMGRTEIGDILYGDDKN
jgi:hypothetical protein